MRPPNPDTCLPLLPSSRHPARVYPCLILLAILLVGCGRTSGADAQMPEVLVLEEIAGGTCGLEIANHDSLDDDALIRRLIEAESNFMAAREIAPLMALWAEDSRIVNAKHTPDDEEDNQIWRGKDAIRHRYLNVVFPSAPQSPAIIHLDISVQGETARARGTTQIGGEFSPNGDLWTLRRENGCWMIVELTYNLEPLPPTG